MRKSLRIAVWGVGIPATLLTLFMTLSWSKRNLDWYLPVKSARLTVDGLANRRMSLFRSTYAFFALLPDRTMVLIQSSSGQKQTYVILGPSPGHLPEGFKGSIRRCESVFAATPLFGFAADHSECVTPAPNRVSKRDAKFDTRFVEFS
jgi:hypothetical protein